MSGYLAAIILVVLLPSCVISQRCPYGWLNREGSNSCYLVTHDGVAYTWSLAKERCHSLQGHLVIIETVEEKEWLITTLGRIHKLYPDIKEWWIGISDLQDGRGLVWEDGSTPNSVVIQWPTVTPTMNNLTACGWILDLSFDIVKCTYWRHFICERSKDVPLSCEIDDGWTGLNNKCYKMFNGKRTFTDANNQCNLNDGELASAPDDNTQSFLWGLAKNSGGNTWFGLSTTSQRKPVKWMWTKGTALENDHVYWKDDTKSQALIPNANQTCVQLEVVDPKIKRRLSWSTNNCADEKGFVCEKPQGVCEDGWLIHQKNCYQLNSLITSSWNAANIYCKAQGGNLLKIESVSDQLFIVANVLDDFPRGSAGIWLGVIDINKNGVFTWGDGKPLGKFSNWLAKPIKANASTNACTFIDTGDVNGKWQITSDCTQVKPFVCQIPVNQPVKKATLPPEPLSCEGGWILYSSYCYQFNDTDSSWLDSRKSCSDSGGDLARIMDSSTQSFMLDQVEKQRGNYWIGLNDRISEGNFTWLDDNTQLNYTFWGTGQPNNVNNSENCVYLQGARFTGRWLDFDCSKKLNFICQKPARQSKISTPAPTMASIFNPKCGLFWEDNPHSPYCYQFRKELLSWADAADSCRHEGGTLASITSIQEQYYITGRMKGTTSIISMWIGLSDRSQKGGWNWEDDSPLAYLNWDAGEPNNYGGEEDCGAMLIFTSRWNDYNCNKRNGYICKKMGRTMVATTTPKPTPTPSVPAGKYYGCHPGWKSYTSNCYLVVRTSNTWLQARDYCRQNGGDLASIGSREENNFIFSETPEVVCENIHTNDTQCTQWTDDGECSKNPLWMGKNCRSACGLCYRKCENKNKIGRQCENWAHRGECTINPLYMLKQCMQSCSMCDGGEYDAVWIGLNDRDVHMTFSWSDGSPVTYTTWDVREPNNYAGKNKVCVKMFTQKAVSAGKWSDDSCDVTLNGFVCKTKKSIQDTATSNPLSIGCPKNSVGYNSRCYSFVQTKLDFDAAEANCVKLNGHLATVNDRFIQAFLSAELINRDGVYWIGLSDRSNPGTYQWTSQDSLLYTSWESAHTGNENTTCVAMNTSRPVGLWANVNCSDMNPSICQMLREGYTTPPITTLPTTTEHVACPTGWVEYMDSCYKAYTNKRTWIDAQQACLNMGADLASIHNASAQAVIKASLNRYLYRATYWIGLNDRGTEGRLVWSDGTPLDFTSWGSAEPNDQNGREDCVEYSQMTSKWNDNSCFIKNNYICMISRGMNISLTPSLPVTTPTPIACADSGWTYFNGSCYYASRPYGVNSKKSWYDSRRYCQQHGGDLMSIHSPDEDDYILSIIKTRSSSGIYWIGLNDLEGGYKWTDGTVVSYKSWTKGEPNDAFGGQRCVNFYSLTGDWNDDNCMDKFGFICKKLNQSSTPPPTTPTPLILGGCPDDFKAADNSNKCFHVGGLHDRATDWERARNACRSIGPGVEIASISNYFEQAFALTLLRNTVKTGVWIGLFDIHVNGQYTWSDNSEVRYTNWAKGEPSDHWSYSRLRREDCVEIMLDDGRVGQWNDQKCGDARPFLCQASRDLKLPTASPPTSTLCKPGFEPYGSRCYKLVSQSRTWSAAQSSCQTEGANLVSVFDEYEQAFIDLLTQNLQSPFWTGLSDSQTKGVYTWSDGWPRIYSKWGGDEPSRGDGEGCVAIMNRKWNDTMCNASYPYICMINTELPPPTTPMPSGRCRDPNWTMFGDYCYYSVVQTKSWPEARYVCQRQGMELVSLQSKKEMIFVKDLITSTLVTTRRYFYSSALNSVSRIWLGLYKVEKAGFQWTDNKPTLYLNWATGEPSDTDAKLHEDCVEMYTDSGLWNDLDCFTNRAFVCKTRKIFVSTTLVPTTAANTKSEKQQPILTTQASFNQRSTVAAASGGITPSGQTNKPKTRDLTFPFVVRPSPSRLSKTQDSPSSLTGGQIAGIVIGTIGLVIIVAVLLIVVKRRKAKLPLGFGSVGFDNALYNKANAQDTAPTDSVDFSDFNTSDVIRIGQVQA
ncbi:macrophage mannose receptor 1 [Patella vulgata]|uniref:macrophage mannose receptor 1 n=1 Tax=Patella vulgata TaxID=6465 RepID=UPI0024A9436A|nr:macrophage mannose receptor 1 [Patella vulgata]